ncbi:MAG: prolipoprotein diacylglyceryl transferase [Clostridia bacterium]|nr:prolipoprotein diacylglyceryl transferase [Clostridia bacterium]
MLPGKIFGLFYMYGLMISLGLLACFGLLFFFGKKKKIEEGFIDYLLYSGLASIALGFGSASLFQSVYNYIDNPEAGFQFGGGMTFIGGLIGGVAVFLILYSIFRKKYKTRLIDVLSFIPCCILIAHAFGRVGCFFAGCCYGKPTDSFLGVQFPNLPYKVHATQLYEAIFLFALCAVCFLLYWKKNFRHNFSVYLIAYGIFRFCIEFLRGDDRGKLLGFISPSQFWSILMVVLGVACYFLSEYFYKRRAAEVAAITEAESVTNAEIASASVNSVNSVDSESGIENAAESVSPTPEEELPKFEEKPEELL